MSTAYLRAAASILVVACTFIGCSEIEPEPTQNSAETPDDGSWFPSENIDDMSAEALEALEAIGYLSATTDARATQGVTIHDEARAYAGVNVFVSGDAPRAELLDMNGNVLHEWRKSVTEVWPDFPVTEEKGILVRDAMAWVPGVDKSLIERLPDGLPDQQSRGYSNWRRAHLFPNGDLLALVTNVGVVKLDKDSNVIWATAFMAHHDMHVTESGDIYVLGKRLKHDPRLSSLDVVVNDTITVLSAEGKILREFDLGEAFRKSVYAPFIAYRDGKVDILHTNTVEMLDGRLADRIPAFKKGNILISCLRRDAIAVFDIETETIAWALSGMFRRMHQPTVLENGNILIFDNQGNYGKSRVFEFDPVTHEIDWMYAPTPGDIFFSHHLGVAQRLPNGNTFVIESTRGRLFEITPENDIVWEYLSPHRGGENGELVAAAFEAVRYSREYVQGWLEGPN